MPIDFHAHWIPAAVSAALRIRKKKPRLVREADGSETMDSPFFRVPLSAGFDDVPTRLAEMDRCGVTRAVLSLTSGYGFDSLPAKESAPLCRLYNDAVSELCLEHPARFSALAALPMADLDAAVAEFERAMKLPGMVGALIPGDAFLTAKRAERFSPLVAAANKRSAVLLVHYGRLADDPHAPTVEASDNGMIRYGTLDMQTRLSANMVTFCLTDFLDQYPDVTMLSHNLGGNIAFEADRMDHRCMLETPGRELPSKRFKAARVMVDCNSFGARQIELAVEVYGADKIVYGTDGTELGMNWSSDAIAQARIPKSAKAAILDGNAARVLARVKTAPVKKTARPLARAATPRPTRPGTRATPQRSHARAAR